LTAGSNRYAACELRCNSHGGRNITIRDSLAALQDGIHSLGGFSFIMGRLRHRFDLERVRSAIASTSVVYSVSGGPLRKLSRSPLNVTVRYQAIKVPSFLFCPQPGLMSVQFEVYAATIVVVAPRT